MIVVTGGSGFIGSHLVDRLVKTSQVTVIDNLSSSANYFIKKHIENRNVIFHKADLKKGCSFHDDTNIVYHLAGVPDVREGTKNPEKVLKENILSTINVLEACRKNDVEKIVFASTSTVYGIAEIPTKESSPLNPISNYAASKVACEAMIKGYSETYGINGTSLRYANIFGPRAKHGVLKDLFYKLRKNKKVLEVLGNGKQNKSYLYIDDCVDATILASRKLQSGYNAINVGSNEQITVNEIVKILIDELGLRNVAVEYTGGDSGWVGDVPVMLLDVKNLKRIGWRQKISTEKGIRMYIKWLRLTK